MKPIHLKLLAISAALVMSAPTFAANYDNYDVVFGKDQGWLFTGYEYVKPSDAKDTQTTIDDLIQASKLFRKDGVGLAILIVPSKIRIYADELPADRPIDAYNMAQYSNAMTALRAGGVNVVDLNSAYLAMTDRAGDNLLYWHLDTHWTPKGALVAAETIKSTVMANPELKAAWAATPEVKYDLTWSPTAHPSRARDLVHYLKPGTATFPPERAKTFTVERATASTAGLTGAGDTVGVTVIGSSYTDPGTGYPDAVRYELQRDVLALSLPVDQGPWSGMAAYLKNEFKTSKPKLIIWEIPERDLHSPPAAKWREARYQIDNAQWLQEITQDLK